MANVLTITLEQLQNISGKKFKCIMLLPQNSKLSRLLQIIQFSLASQLVFDVQHCGHTSRNENGKIETLEIYSNTFSFLRDTMWKLNSWTLFASSAVTVIELMSAPTVLHIRFYKMWIVVYTLYTYHIIVYIRIYHYSVLVQDTGIWGIQHMWRDGVSGFVLSREAVSCPANISPNAEMPSNISRLLHNHPDRRPHIDIYMLWIWVKSFKCNNSPWNDCKSSGFFSNRSFICSVVQFVPPCLSAPPFLFLTQTPLILHLLQIPDAHDCFLDQSQIKIRDFIPRRLSLQMQNHESLSRAQCSNS